MQFFKTDDNVKLAYEDIFPQGQRTVFFIHGWPLDHTIFEYQYDILPSRGYRCIGLDLRGFGQSDCPAGGYSYDRMAQDVYTLIRSLQPRGLILAGFSMGGGIALRYMARYKGYRVSKLALLAAAAPSFVQRPGYPFGMTREAVDGLLASVYRDRPQTVTDFGKLFFGAPHSLDVGAWFNDIGWRASGLGTIGGLESLRDEDLRADLASVNVPTGIFHGRLDRVCPFAFAEEMHRGIARSELYPFEASGHAIFYDELEDFNRRFLDFLHKPDGTGHNMGIHP